MDDVFCTTSQQEGDARLRAEIQSLRAQLEESQETLRAIREGEVDALVVSTPEGERLFTLQGGEHPYRALIEQMREGAATLTPEGVIHYCNHRLAEMLKLPLERIMGSRIDDFIAPDDRALLATMLSEGRGRTELTLTASDATEVPALGVGHLAAGRRSGGHLRGCHRPDRAQAGRGGSGQRATVPVLRTADSIGVGVFEYI